LDYPFRRKAPELDRSLLAKAKTWYETARISRRERRDRIAVELQPVREVAALAPNDIPLVVITHNDMAILPFFFRHYRALGVTRFICVDDVSRDGTRDFLLAQPDVDLWTSPLRYGQARRGRRWREALFERYGYDRWYVNVDSDELLVYDQCEGQGLSALIRVLTCKGCMRLAAPMIDLYPGPGSAVPDAATDAPWMFSNCFDGSGYDCHLDKRGISMKGGPRRRCFGEDNELIKYPLIFWDRSCFFGSSPHRPLPYQRNFTPYWGALLHFKFFVNYRQKIAEAAEEKQHYNDAAHYKAMMAELQRGEGLALADQTSLVYGGSRQLEELGFITPIGFSQR
jgi:hypothetical protein